MCLKTTKTKAEIAEKDIIVYKVIRRRKNINVSWEAPVRGTTHPFNKILKAIDNLDFIYIRHPHTLIWTGYRQVKEGFHAYTEPSGQKLYRIRRNGTLFAKAIIPKGSEYEEHVKEPSKNANNLEWLRFSLFKDPNYRKEPIYKHDGILFSIFNGKENPIIGYKYYKYVGSQMVFVCGQKMADWIYDRKKLLKKISNLNR